MVARDPVLQDLSGGGDPGLTRFIGWRGNPPLGDLSGDGESRFDWICQVAGVPV